MEDIIDLNKELLKDYNMMKFKVLASEIMIARLNKNVRNLKKWNSNI